MALTYKKQDDLEKMLANFATLPKIKTKDEEDDKIKKEEGK